MDKKDKNFFIFVITMFVVLMLFSVLKSSLEPERRYIVNKAEIVISVLMSLYILWFCFAEKTYMFFTLLYIGLLGILVLLKVAEKIALAMHSNQAEHFSQWAQDYIIATNLFKPTVLLIFWVMSKTYYLLLANSNTNNKT